MSQPEFTSSGFPPPPPPTVSGPAPVSEERPKSVVVMLVGLAIVAIGSLLPWASASAAFVRIEKGGMEGDGKITIILSGGALIWYLVKSKNLSGRPLLGMIIGLLCAIIAIIDINDVQGLRDGKSGVLIQVGFGLWLCLIGGVLSFFAGILTKKK